MGERLLHYAARPLGELRDVEQRRTPDGIFKPRGLWVSVKGEDDWPSWCVGERFDLDRLRYAHEITLHNDAAILRVTTAAQIDEITAEHGIDLLEGRGSYRPYYMAVDWPEVAEKWDGIVIAPYQWSRRLDGDARWYYAWDCASGCIWRTRAIASARLLCDA